MISTDRLLRTRAHARDAVTRRNALSQWRVIRPTTGGVTDPVTGDFTPATTTVWEGDAHYSSKGRPIIRDRADTALTLQGPTLCVAVDHPPFAEGDTVEMVTGADPILTGRTWRITGTPGDSYDFHRHYPLEEVTDGNHVDGHVGGS